MLFCIGQQILIALHVKTAGSPVKSLNTCNVHERCARSFKLIPCILGYPLILFCFASNSVNVATKSEVGDPEKKKENKNATDRTYPVPMVIVLPFDELAALFNASRISITQSKQIKNPRKGH